LAKHKSAQTRSLWYNLRETAAFAMLHLGTVQQKTQARQIIKELIAGKTPGKGFERPPLEWRKTLWQEYLQPQPDGRVEDPHQIGQISEPTA
jgi:hypothetical protein